MLRLLARIGCACVAASVVVLPGQPTAAANVIAGNPDMVAVSRTSWTEPGSGALHLMGQVQNTGSSNLTQITVHLDVATSGGVLHDSIGASLALLKPSEVSPFDDTLFPAPAGFTGFTVPSIDAAPSANAPYQSPDSLQVDITPCPNTDLTSADCQEHMTGTVTNIGPVTVDNVFVALTLPATTGGPLVGTAHLQVLSGASTTLNHGDVGSFELDRPMPAWTGNTADVVAIAEPFAYPIDVNPTSIAFGDQFYKTPSVTQTVTISNTGSSTMHVTAVGVSQDYSESDDCGSVAYDQSCQIVVGFTPTVIGDDPGLLTITDDAAGSAQTVPLSGRGVAPLLSLNPASALPSFGTVTPGTTTAAQVETLTNIGTAPLSISAIGITAGSTDFALAGVANQCAVSLNALAVNASCNLGVTFSPSDGGTRNGTLTIADNSGGVPHNDTIALTGVGNAPAASIDPTQLDFGSVVLQSPVTKSITLTNTGVLDLVLSPPPAAGGDYAAGNCPSTRLHPTDHCAISVTFTPTATGSRPGTLTLTDNAGTGTQTVPLTGTGLGAVAGLSGTTAFGNQAVGSTSAPSIITLTNSGQIVLHIQTISTTGDFGASPTAVNGCAASGTLNPQASCTIAVVFSPTALGTRNGALTVTDDATGSGQQVLALSGTGTLSGANVGVWEPLGGYLTSGPAVASWGPNRLDVFVRGPFNNLYHKSWNGTSWSAYENLGGTLTSDPAAVSPAPGRIDVFVRGPDNALWHMSFHDNAWSGWESLSGWLTSGPSVASWAANRLDVFVRGPFNNLYHKSWDGQSWTPYENLGGTLTSDPAAVSWSIGRIDVFVRGPDNALWHKSFHNNAWSGWDSLGGWLTSAPAAASWGANRLDVFVSGPFNAAYHKAWNGSAWSAWESLGGSLTSKPAAVSRTTGSVDVFVRGPDAGLWHQTILPS
jgi:Repeat of unknown function (DUF346)/Abnormal spindle-like microcephaly-assoc'd, ASPM-SPD-2-Hydin